MQPYSVDDTISKWRVFQNNTSFTASLLDTFFQRAFCEAFMQRPLNNFDAFIKQMQLHSDKW